MSATFWSTPVNEAGCDSNSLPKPLWLLAELTYACPLQCPYCSNPIDFTDYRDELSTEEWIELFDQARALGSVQLGLSGGEPLARRDLETLIREGRQLGFYTNLITSGLGMDEARIKTFKKAGLDHIQISFQASSRQLNDFLGGRKSFSHKLEVAGLIKKHGYPMVLNVVIHRYNIGQIEQILEMATQLGADYVELANTQYYGWAWLNRDQLLPSREQVSRAESIAHAYQERVADHMKIYYVVPDYYEQRPKACMQGWGSTHLTIAPDGTALPCQAARQLPGLSFPNVRDTSLDWIWHESGAFNRFRGFEWMQEPCRSCPERFQDFGGCRCQAYQFSEDPTATDPVCSLSPNHHHVEEAIETARNTGEGTPTASPPLSFRNPKNSKALSR